MSICAVCVKVISIYAMGPRFGFLDMIESAMGCFLLFSHEEDVYLLFFSIGDAFLSGASHSLYVS